MMYAPARLYEEIAYVAYHFHWSLNDIIDMDHLTRRRFVSEIASINKRLSAPPIPEFSGPIFGLNAPFRESAGFASAGRTGGGGGDGERMNYGLAQL